MKVFEQLRNGFIQNRNFAKSKSETNVDVAQEASPVMREEKPLTPISSVSAFNKRT